MTKAIIFISAIALAYLVVYTVQLETLFMMK